MGPVVRRIDAGEVGAFVASVAVPFFEAGNDEENEEYARYIEPDRAWVAVDGDRFVGNACAFTRDVTVPGPPGGPCPVLGLAAVSGVGVHPTHRRQGLLTRMMTAVVDDARERGEVIAGLEASESGIYGRFGFGPATVGATTSIRTHRSRFQVTAPAPAARLLDAGEAAKVLPALHDRLRRRAAGEVDRPESSWAHLFADRPATRRGGSGLYYLASEDGFAVYRAHDTSDGGIHGGRLEVLDLYAAGPEAEAGLWRLLFDIDLVWTVTARRRPVDDPLRWRLADPRQLQVKEVRDLLWIRILDVAGALAGRRYRVTGRLVIDVVGDDAAVAGTWALEAGPDGAECRRAPGGEADIRLGAAALGALYLGGVSATALAGAGRVSQIRHGGLRQADHILAADTAPVSGTLF
jgi:predicted acetyltransferase